MVNRPVWQPLKLGTFVCRKASMCFDIFVSVMMCNKVQLFNKEYLLHVYKNMKTTLSADDCKFIS